MREPVARKPPVMIEPKPWDWPGPRVLLEQPFDGETQTRVDALRRAGFAVSICPGPAPGDPCPLACGEGCRTAEDADVIVSALGPDMVDTVHGALPRRPLVVLPAGATPAELVVRVQEALDA